MLVSFFFEKPHFEEIPKQNQTVDLFSQPVTFGKVQSMLLFSGCLSFHWLGQCGISHWGWKTWKRKKTDPTV